MNFFEELSAFDPEVGAACAAELERQRRNIELIASENIVSKAVLLAAGGVLTNKYAEGFPSKRYYGGCECVDVVENIARERAKALSKLDRLVLLCGHYEGVDERVNTLIDEEISIGDYVLTGGELPAMVLVDCLSRFIPGVLGSEESAEDESHANGLLEYPQYTRPASFRGLDVPEILLNGHHANIQKWRHKEAMEKTRKVRPCLLGNFGKNPENKQK